MRTKLLLFIGALAFVVFAPSCIPAIKVSTVHPDSDKIIIFDANKGGTKGTVTAMKIEVAGTVVQTNAGTTATFTGGPYPIYSNNQLHYKAIAEKSNGSLVNGFDNWVYVANPKGAFGYIVASGSNSGYPNATSEQTGANLYRLDKAVVRNHATNALMEYANDEGISLFEAANISDHMVAAVARYVDSHMSWRSDATNRTVFSDNGWASYAPGWDFPQPADLTLTISGDLINASPNDDFQGDCEDHAILRAALLRAMGFAPWAIWDAIDNPVTHEYNVVLYEGAYRLMDYGEISRWLDSHTWSSHQSYYGWNESNGPRSAVTLNNDYLKNNTDNFPGGKTCPGAWDYLKYYKDKCE